tara:strand:+ start:8489 stop:8719 length:231 start_codon:yes stop_codon:yes gene_type:complete
MLITRNKTIEVLSETNPDKREIAECGKKAMQEICNKWIKDFAMWVHSEQQKTGGRDKIYSKDVHAAFSTFYHSGEE